jgi:hypothetical protein
MPNYNFLQDENVLQKSGGSFLLAFLSSFILSCITLGVYPFLVARNSGVAVTDERIIIKQGKLLGSKTAEVRLDNVQGVSTNGRALQVSNAAGENFDILVSNTDQVRTAINQAQR